MYENLGAGKASVSINAKTAEGRKALMDMIKNVSTEQLFFQCSSPRSANIVVLFSAPSLPPTCPPAHLPTFIASLVNPHVCLQL